MLQAEAVQAKVTAPEFAAGGRASLPIVLNFEPVLQLDDNQFFEFCQINQAVRIERAATGEVLVMPPAGGETGNRNLTISMALGLWAKRDKSGVAFDSSTGFNLPNGAMRSPDAAWVLRNRLTSLTPEQKRKFLPLCPDFVIELQSPSDTLEGLQGKLQEYIDNGAQLGWLIEPDTHSVYIYRPGQEPEHLQSPGYVNGDPVLPDFVLDLTDIWEPGF